MKNIFLLSVVCFVLSTSLAYAKNKISVVTTIGQITNITEEIGGEHLDVKGLMGPGVDPHLYKASAGDVTKLSNASIILYSGLHLEAKMADVFKKMGRYKTTDALAEVIDSSKLLGSDVYKDQYDPHVWFDVELWIEVTKRIEKVLSEYDIEHKKEYQENMEQYISKLEDLHRYLLRRSSELREEQRILVTAHDAFRYFGRAYGFKVFGLQGISTESKAGTRDVIELANYIAENKVKAIFVESSVPIRNIQAVQEAVQSRGWNVKIGGELFSDALGARGTAEGTYIGMVRHNIDTIVNALKD